MVFLHGHHPAQISIKIRSSLRFVIVESMAVGTHAAEFLLIMVLLSFHISLEMLAIGENPFHSLFPKAST